MQASPYMYATCMFFRQPRYKGAEYKFIQYNDYYGNVEHCGASVREQCTAALNCYV